MAYFNIVAQSSESTVVTEYKSQAKCSDAYQSEAELEREFIRLLRELGYEYLPIHKEKDLVDNLRLQLEAVNGYRFSDGEWGRFFSEVLANPKSGIVEKTRLIQEDFVQVLRRDDGSSKNITLFDKKNIHNNRLQVINQYTVSKEEGAAHDNRYDVTVLVNGLPMVHIELKRRGVPIREAFNQIDLYQRDSFWAALKRARRCMKRPANEEGHQASAALATFYGPYSVSINLPTKNLPKKRKWLFRQVFAIWKGGMSAIIPALRGPSSGSESKAADTAPKAYRQGQFIHHIC